MTTKIREGDLDPSVFLAGPTGPLFVEREIYGRL
jgi:hypothetical protein